MGRPRVNGPLNPSTQPARRPPPTAHDNPAARDERRARERDRMRVKTMG